MSQLLEDSNQFIHEQLSSYSGTLKDLMPNCEQIDYGSELEKINPGNVLGSEPFIGLEHRVSIYEDLYVHWSLAYYDRSVKLLVMLSCNSIPKVFNLDDYSLEPSFIDIMKTFMFGLLT